MDEQSPDEQGTSADAVGETDSDQATEERTCAFQFDPRDHESFDPEDDSEIVTFQNDDPVIACHRASVEGGAYCLFHQLPKGVEDTPPMYDGLDSEPATRTESDTEVADLFRRVVTGDTADIPSSKSGYDIPERGALTRDERARHRKQFIGAQFGQLRLRHENLDAGDNYPIDVRACQADDIDFRGASIGCELRFSGSDIGPVWLDEASTEWRIDFRDATVKEIFCLDLTCTAKVLCQRATIEGDFNFGGATIRSLFSQNATIRGRVALDHGTFNGGVSFEDATINGEVDIREVTADGLRFDSAVITGNLTVSDTSVVNSMLLESAVINGSLDLRHSTVEGTVDLDYVWIGENIELDRATLRGRVWLRGAVFEGDVAGTNVTVEETIWVDESTITGDFEFEYLDAWQLTIRSTDIEGTINVADSTVDRVLFRLITVKENLQLLDLEGDDYEIRPAAVHGALEISNTSVTTMKVSLPIEDAATRDDSFALRGVLGRLYLMYNDIDNMTFHSDLVSHPGIRVVEFEGSTFRAGTLGYLDEEVARNGRGVNAGTVYNLTQVTLGDVTIDGPGPRPFSYAWFYGTKFEEFRFSGFRTAFRDTNWRMHEIRPGGVRDYAAFNATHFELQEVCEEVPEGINSEQPAVRTIADAVISAAVIAAATDSNENDQVQDAETALGTSATHTDQTEGDGGQDADVVGSSRGANHDNEESGTQWLFDNLRDQFGPPEQTSDWQTLFERTRYDVAEWPLYEPISSNRRLLRRLLPTESRSMTLGTDEAEPTVTELATRLRDVLVRQFETADANVHEGLALVSRIENFPIADRLDRRLSIVDEAIESLVEAEAPDDSDSTAGTKLDVDVTAVIVSTVQSSRAGASISIEIDSLADRLQESLTEALPFDPSTESAAYHQLELACTLLADTLLDHEPRSRWERPDDDAVGLAAINAVDLDHDERTPHEASAHALIEWQQLDTSSEVQAMADSDTTTRVRNRPVDDTGNTGLIDFRTAEQRYRRFRADIEAAVARSIGVRVRQTGTESDELTAPSVFYGTPSGLEETYVRAKQGAIAEGDQVAAAEFFRRERLFAREQHWWRLLDFKVQPRTTYERRKKGDLDPELIEDTVAQLNPDLGLVDDQSESDRITESGTPKATRRRALAQYLGNVTLAIITGYGEKPQRVLFWAIGTILTFAGLFWSARGGFVSPPPYGSPLGYLVVSMESFVTLVIDGPAVANSAVYLRALAQLEGFLGVSFAALFVFTLTRSVHR